MQFHGNAHDLPSVERFLRSRMYQRASIGVFDKSIVTAAGTASLEFSQSAGCKVVQLAVKPRTHVRNK